MVQIRTHYPSTEAFRGLIRISEQYYEDQLSRAAETLQSMPLLQIVTITGPTCSGKTTTANKLTAALEAGGHPVYMVSIDDFFRNRDTLPRTASGGNDFDTAAAIDLPLLAQCLEKLIRKETVDLPKFDFHAGRRSSFQRYTPKENDIILLEGIQAMYPEVRAYLPHDVTRSVAIQPAHDVFYTTDSGETVEITAREIRLLRRLVRDIRTRGADGERTLSMWGDVCENEDRNIYPYLAEADIRIDSFLPYELSVIRPYAEAVLSALPEDSAYRPTADHLLTRLRGIAVMPSNDVPLDSVFREFIGNPYAKGELS